MPVAKAARIQCADIYVSDNALKHIKGQHSKELDALGIAPLSYVCMIANNFCEIRKGSGDSILLITQYAGLNHAAAITLEYVSNSKNSYWRIRTAQPRRTGDLEKKKLLWKRK